MKTSTAETKLATAFSNCPYEKDALPILSISKEYKDQYCAEKVQDWKGEILTLAEIAKSQPHAAYIVFTKGYKSKFTYCMRTIESFEEYVDPVQQVIDEMFLPTLFGQAEPLPDELSELVTLTPAQGGLGNA